MSLLPPNSSKNEKYLEKVLDSILNKSDENINKISILPNNAHPKLLPFIAYMFGYDFNEFNKINEDEQRKILNNSFLISRHDGTVFALKSVIKTIFDDASVEEWFNNESEPYFFGVSFNIGNDLSRVITDDKINFLRNAIEKHKNVRSFFKQFYVKFPMFYGKIFYKSGVCLRLKLLIKNSKGNRMGDLQSVVTSDGASLLKNAFKDANDGKIKFFLAGNSLINDEQTESDIDSLNLDKIKNLIFFTGEIQNLFVDKKDKCLNFEFSVGSGVGDHEKYCYAVGIINNDGAIISIAKIPRIRFGNGVSSVLSYKINVSNNDQAPVFSMNEYVSELEFDEFKKGFNDSIIELEKEFSYRLNNLNLGLGEVQKNQEKTFFGLQNNETKIMENKKALENVEKFFGFKNNYLLSPTTQNIKTQAGKTVYNIHNFILNFPSDQVFEISNTNMIKFKVIFNLTTENDFPVLITKDGKKVKIPYLISLDEMNPNSTPDPHSSFGKNSIFPRFYRSITPDETGNDRNPWNNTIDFIFPRIHEHFKEKREFFLNIKSTGISISQYEIEIMPYIIISELI